eukprot:ctg_2018.g554
MINCVGVVHHTSDPAAALQCLARKLAPGGILHLFVYAEAGRWEIRRMQQAIALLQQAAGTRGDVRDGALGVGQPARRHLCGHVRASAGARLRRAFGVGAGAPQRSALPRVVQPAPVRPVSLAGQRPDSDAAGCAARRHQPLATGGAVGPGAGDAFRVFPGQRAVSQ